jgi:PII interaction protein X
MNPESYLNHPTFGLLYRICVVEDERELYTTLYAQRMFFIVSNGSNGLSFQTVSRNDARLYVERRLIGLRRNGHLEQWKDLQTIFQQNFTV